LGCNFPYHGDPVFALFIWFITMNDFETLGTLDAAEVFLQDDFDPTPEDLGICPCCCDYDLALEAYRSEA